MKEQFYAKDTLASGSAWDIAFSKDPQQRFMFLADGQNEKVRIILRETLEEISNFGDGGRQPGQFYGVHSIATDSKGNIYTTETYEGKRLQKFVYKGIEAVTAGAGFLAAGIIFQSGAKVHGLTTGAGVWTAAAIGVACGAVRGMTTLHEIPRRPAA